MLPFDRGQLPAVDEPWGFSGVRREVRNVRGDSRVFYVDPNNTLSSDSNSGEDPMYPLLTIQQAVTNTRAYKGDTIYVISNDGWIYGSGTSDIIAETVTIPATKPGISLIGVGAGSIGVYWSPENASETCLTINAIDVIVSGFAFTGNGSAADGISCEWDGATMYGENATICNCFFDSDIETAIQLEYAWYNHIYNCMFSECATYGIWSDVAGSGTEYNRIHHNRFVDIRGTAAIALLGGGDNNYIAHNWIYNTDAENGAAATNEGINLTGGANNLVSQNVFSCLLPVPANGDWDDFNTASATDAWVQNYCLDGPNTTNPT